MGAALVRGGRAAPSGERVRMSSCCTAFATRVRKGRFHVQSASSSESAAPAGPARPSPARASILAAKEACSLRGANQFIRSKGK
jgi:hypothetical protein